MVDTIMALWNLIFRKNVAQYAIARQRRFWAIPLMLALLLICISISLLLVTVGGAWPFLLHTGKNPNGSSKTGSRITLTVVTAQSTASATSSVPATVTPIVTSTVATCLGTPTTISSHGIPATPTASHGQGGKGKQPSTPTPVPTQPSPQPTPPIISISPIVNITPPSTPTATPTVTPSPTASPTPGVTPTATATPSPTETPSPAATATATATTTPDASPTASPSNGIEAPASGGGPGIGGQQNGNPAAANCLNDSLRIDGNEAVLSSVEQYFWIILSCAILGTLVFCGGIYRLRQRG